MGNNNCCSSGPPDTAVAIYYYQKTPITGTKKLTKSFFGNAWKKDSVRKSSWGLYPAAFKVRKQIEAAFPAALEVITEAEPKMPDGLSFAQRMKFRSKITKEHYEASMAALKTQWAEPLNAQLVPGFQVVPLFYTQMQYISTGQYGGTAVPVPYLVIYITYDGPTLEDTVADAPSTSDEATSQVSPKAAEAANNNGKMSSVSPSYADFQSQQGDSLPSYNDSVKDVVATS